ncbi:MAG: S1 RNA-binding domain-containing protein, partial [Deltaproteobacteria bacterium]|nr:S1 RNA-binding domain-containing protein [Deltaproteobacteria bacterium]
MVNEENVNVEKQDETNTIESGSQQQVVVESQDEVSQMEEAMSFGDLYEQSLQDVPYGEILTGRVVQINPDVVMVDVGYKTEGQVRVEELVDKDGNMTVAEGDEIEVVVD